MTQSSEQKWTAYYTTALQALLFQIKGGRLRQQITETEVLLKGGLCEFRSKEVAA